jgi:hypothetical protein
MNLLSPWRGRLRIFEVVKPHFDLRSTHCFGISKVLAKFDAVPLLHAFSHYWAKCIATSTYYSTSHTSCLEQKDAPGEAAKNHACA